METVNVQYEEISFVYGIQSLDLIKVGVAKDVNRRLETMRLLNPHGCELVFYRRTHAPYIFERSMHRLLADKAVGREWFRVTTAELRKAANIAKCDARKAINHVEGVRVRWIKRNGHPNDAVYKDINNINDLQP